MPKLIEVNAEHADLAWLIYDLVYDPITSIYKLRKVNTVYTNFEPAMLRLTTADFGPMKTFIDHLQSKLDEKLDNNSPDVSALSDIPVT